ncbi:MAG TPA: magnesium-translocating P-type ATPase [Aggregatilineaceae bacterium]|nr:magnesium-translocating P-type ATPase [Aggregatilineaceae bacterium]
MQSKATILGEQKAKPADADAEVAVYWSQPAGRLFQDLHASPDGLSSLEAEKRLQQFGPNVLKAQRRSTPVDIFLNQFRSPLVLILIFAAIISAFVQDWIDSAIILVIVLGSAILGFVQEYRAAVAIEKLNARVRVQVTALRDGQARSIPAEQVVPGDVVLLSAGNLIPADGIVLEAKDFNVSQAALTGETFPLEKTPGTVPFDASLTERTNCAFMGTNVRSGTARMLVVQTGPTTAYGHIAQRLTLRPPETEFERGVRHFGQMLTQVMIVLVVVVFAANLLGHKPPIDSLLFAIALAVGITPELLPAIVTVTLSQGAQRMADHGVIVRRLNSIENLGNMEILCTDKTGTLTEGVVRLEQALDVEGQPSAPTLLYASLNAHFQTGLANPLDEAILVQADKTKLPLAAYRKLDEIPYDFLRKRLSIVVQDDKGQAVFITKGALDSVLGICTQVLDGESVGPLDQARQEQIRQRYATWGSDGFRVLGVAIKSVSNQPQFTTADERDLRFAGFLLFSDPPKPDVQKTLADLAGLGVQLKVITGDNRFVAAHLATNIGMKVEGILTGAELNTLTDEALWNRAEHTTLFVEVDPNQKERVISALRKMGHVVGYMGDGINDAPALYASDVGISVDTAVDVAKEAADFVLLKRDLEVLCEGVAQGRTTFINTLKYVSYTTSANFGNMFSMAGASILLPFLPMTATQILLNNFLSDLPALTIADDNVDPELVAIPHRWDVKLIRNYMVVFGLISSVFDYLTFGVLLIVTHSTSAQFQTGWFVESLLTEVVVLLVLRTRRLCFRSKPGTLLWVSSLGVAVIALIIPYLPFSAALGFVPLPLSVMALLLLITALYVVATEVAKYFFYQHN